MDFLIEYRVSADKVNQQEAAVREFIAALKAEGDRGYRYTSYKKPDGVSFVHHAWMEDDAAQARFRSRPQFNPFADGLKARCEEGPTVTRIDIVASSAD